MNVASSEPLVAAVAGNPSSPHLAVEHHYLVVTIDKDTLELCPRRSDGKLLEKCTRYRLWRP